MSPRTTLARPAAACGLVLAALAAGCGGGSDAKPAARTEAQVIEFHKPPAAPRESAVYRTSFYTAKPPAGWRLVADAKHLTPTLVRAKWVGPGGLGADVLIDAVRGGAGSPAARAESVRSNVSARPGYRELTFKADDLGDVAGKEWRYDRGATRVVDWFFDHCGDGFAVQGTAPAATFARYEAAFRRVAESVVSACH